MAWGYAVGFLVSMAIYLAILARFWPRDVVGAVTRAWFTSMGVYAVVFGLALLAAWAHRLTGVLIGGVYAEAGFGYALALLAELLVSAFIFAVGYDFYVESLRRSKA